MRTQETFHVLYVNCDMYINLINNFNLRNKINFPSRVCVRAY